MKIIEADDDNLVFERAFVAKNENGVFVPRCFFSGIPCELDWKPGPLGDGIVACWPLEPDLRDNWPISVTLEKENTHGDPYQETMPNCTGNPRAVAAVRKFIALQEAGELEVGKAL